MSDWQLSTPVAFIIFNRPDTTSRVFEAIRRARPPHLLVVADGPRPDRAGEAERCAAARAVIERVDWPCMVQTDFSDVNRGCRDRVASGIDWVFSQVEEAILLEDDCLPHDSFFRYCEELLAHYRHDTRIAMISGDNFQFGRQRGDGSYYFSRYTHIWGWASWRRAWRYYRRDAGTWPQVQDGNWLAELANSQAELDHWNRAFQAVFEGRIDTWDYQWNLTVLTQGMLSIMPNVNLISNIGFGVDATHTTEASAYADLPLEPMEFPMRHPTVLLRHRTADAFTAQGMFTWKERGPVYRRLRALKRMLIGPPRPKRP